MRVGCRERPKIKSKELDPGLRRDDEVGGAFAGMTRTRQGAGSRPSPGWRSSDPQQKRRRPRGRRRV